MSTLPRSPGTAIVGFGFSGLAVLAHLVDAGAAGEVAVVCPDTSGHGLAYQTTDVAHLLNVPAERMGLYARDPSGFADWLETADASSACRDLGIPVPDAETFAPRALFARYLDAERAAVLTRARAAGLRVAWIRGRAQAVNPGPDGWRIGLGDGRAIDAARCVLATGQDARRVFGAFAHPHLHPGPWAVEDWAAGEGPIVLIGSGLTAVDAVLSARGRGRREPIVMLSRGGRLPCAHTDELSSVDYDPRELAAVDSLDAVFDVLRVGRAAGHDWRAVLDGLRPFTQEIWQRLPAADREQVAARHGQRWSIHRHRMAPDVAERIAAERRAGTLRVLATERITPSAPSGRLEIAYAERGGRSGWIEPAMVIDCTGPQLACGESEQPLLRGLVAQQICTPHHTGLGLAATADHAVAEHLYAVGNLLAGQLWESVAVPELRDQAAVVATRLSGDGVASAAVAA